MELIKYEAARRALIDANSIDEIKDLRDKALAMEAYARQAKDGELVAMAIEIKLRATRCIGALIAELKVLDKLAKGTRGQLKGTTISGGLSIHPPEKQPTLVEQGIDKN